MIKIHQVWVISILSSCLPSTVIAESISFDNAPFTANSVDSSRATTSVKMLNLPNAPRNITRQIRLDNQKNLLIAAFKNVVSYDGNQFSNVYKAFDLESYDAFDVIQDASGNIWIASTSKGVFVYDGHKVVNYTVADGLGSNRTMYLHQDNSGKVWVATLGGLSVFDPSSVQADKVQFSNFTTQDGLTSNDINIVLQDSAGKFWIGTRGTLNTYQPQPLPGPNSGKFSQVTDAMGNQFNNVWSVIEDAKGSIWFSDDQGIWRVDKGTTKLFSKDSNARLMQDSTGNLWFARNNEVAFYPANVLQSARPQATLVHKGTSMIFALTQDTQGAIWVGTLQGVFRYDGESVTQFH